MRPLNIKTFNHDAQVLAMSNYICKYWEGADHGDIYNLVDFVFDEGYRCAEYWMDTHASDEVVRHLELRREYLNNMKSPDVFYLYDELYNLVGALCGRSAYKRLILKNWSYDRETERVLRMCLKGFQNTTIKNLKPKGYDAFLEDYIDYDGMEELNERELIDDYDGMDFSALCSGEFPIIVSLPHVAYNDTNQGRKPLQVLVNAIFSQALVARQSMNDAIVAEFVLSLDIASPYCSKKCAQEIKMVKCDIVEYYFGVIGRESYPENVKYISVDEVIPTAPDLLDKLNKLIIIREEKDRREKEVMKLAQDMLSSVVEGNKLRIHSKYSEEVEKFGIKVLFAIVETKDEKLMKLRFEPNLELFYVHDDVLGYIPYYS